MRALAIDVKMSNTFFMIILYNIIMKNVFDIFTSRARALILRTLYFQKEHIPLRHISAISNLPVFSVQNAVTPLVDEKIIKRIEKDNNVLFELNKEYPLYSVLEHIFIVEVNNRISLEAAAFYERAVQILEFATAANIIFKRAKQKRGVQ